VAFDGTNICVGNQSDNTVTELRASDGAKLGTFNVGNSPVGVAFDGTNIWVLTPTETPFQSCRAKGKPPRPVRIWRDGGAHSFARIHWLWYGRHARLRR